MRQEKKRFSREGTRRDAKKQKKGQAKKLLAVKLKWDHVKKFFREQKVILDYAILHGIKFKK